MSNELRDITIIGGGPTGLFAAFYAGVRGMSARIVDSLPELGGQLMALYPEKYIYDVGGFPKVLAKDLAQGLIRQAMQFEPEVQVDDEVRELVRDGEHWALHCRNGTYLSRTVLIAGGKGAFEPKVLDVPGYEEYLHRGVGYSVRDPQEWAGRNVLIIGGGDSALDWALILKDIAARTIVAHRRDGFRAHEQSVEQLHAAADAGEIELRLFHEVREIHGDADRGVTGVTLFDNRTDEDETLEMDGVLTFLGFKPDLGPIKRWGLDLERNRIRVDALMKTNLPGVYAAGDIVDHEGKLDLIATGFGEAAIAVNNAVHDVNPDARVNPGHSTSMAVFKE
jgi:thioredoxin reductase